MTLIADTGPLVASVDAADPWGAAVRERILAEPRPVIIPAPVGAEVDHLLRRRLGNEPARLFLEDVAAGRYRVECLDPDEHALAVEVDRSYGDLGLGLADASIVVLAARFDTPRVLTFDERDFRAITPLQGGTFTLLPADR